MKHSNHRLFFENLAESWDAMQPPDRDVKLEKLLSSFKPVLSGSRLILEVGTGTGVLIPILKKLSPNAHVAAIDLALAMLKQANLRCKTGLLVQADAIQLPFPALHFQSIICHNSFPHFPDKGSTLTEFFRVLTVEGQLIILHDAPREKVNAVHMHASDPTIHQDMLPGKDDMHTLFHNAGFEDINIEDTEDHYFAMGQRE
jgi:demethylmenaquinone methyltransferase/2-methoxy-6-polyprenyl-1,4-benzoquinol methylase